MYEKDLTIVPNGGSFGIRSIYEDREGHYWFCNTQHRYDINLEATAKSDRLQYNKIKGIGDANVFGGNEYIYYSHIIEDQHGDIWLTTWSEGVYKYDGHHITPVSYTHLDVYKRQRQVWAETTLKKTA